MFTNTDTVHYEILLALGAHTKVQSKRQKKDDNMLYNRGCVY